MSMYAMGSAMMTLMLLVLIAVVALLVVGTVWMSRSLTRPRVPARIEDEEVLRRRYAAGEIDDDEFMWRLGTLRGLR
jgi:putative membrane protein